MFSARCMDAACFYLWLSCQRLRGCSTCILALQIMQYPLHKPVWHCMSTAVHICPSQGKTATAHYLLQKLDQQLREEAQEEDKEYTGSLTVLIDITFELLRPYKDLRKTNLRDLSLTEAFWLLSGETEDTLKPGRRVQATIQGLSAMAAFCTLPDIRDMEAVISSTDISSSGEVRPDSRLRRGDTVPARSVNGSLP